MLELGQAWRGSNDGAWALYQAGLAAEAHGDSSGATHAFADLRLTYPQHFPALRVKTTPARGEKHAPPHDTLADCGPRALQVVCQKMGVPSELQRIRQQAHTTPKGTSMAGLAQAARVLGLKATGVQVDRDALRELRSPALAWVDGNHYLAVFAVDEQRANVRDPNHRKEEWIETEDLLRRSGGILLLLSR